MDYKKLIEKIKIYIVPTITITLCGEMYFFPFQDPFRFSVGVIAFSIILLFYEEIKELYLGLSTAVSVLTLRCLLYYFEGNYALIELLEINIPGAIYYIIYSILFYMLKTRQFSEFPARTIYLISIGDAVSNIIEALIRFNLSSQLIFYIIIVAIARSAIIYIIYYLLKHRELSIKKFEHKKKYNQLNAIISNIQSEIFYLTKSKSDIENVMSKAYKLYEKSKGNEEINHIALDVAREVHEIKKDYYRIETGFKSYVDNFDYDNTMYLKDIGAIIGSNLTRYIEYLGKDIQVSINLSNNMKVKNYYYLFTIINNLITNAIDAILDAGEISVEGKANKENYILKVTDNGPGIDEDFRTYIFNPGFTTKFDSETGISSTGIGLAHVKYIVDSLNGTIRINSKINIGTTFTLIIPINELRG